VAGKQESWTRLSDALEQIRTRGVRSLSPEQAERLGGWYRAVVSDLAFARSQGASDDLVAYLNELAGRAHGALYASEGARLRGAIRFLTNEFPALFRGTWRYALVAMLLFVAGWAAAAYIFYTMADAWMAVIPEQFRELLSQPPQDTKQSGTTFGGLDPAELSGFIMTNNIKVSFLAFATGIFFGLGTLYVIVYNGMLLGTSAAVIQQYGVSLNFWAFVLPHGVIELTAIVISGGAGFKIGYSLINPGRYTKKDALKLAARESMPLIGGIVCMLLVAGVIEAFVSPMPEIPSTIKIVIACFEGVALFLYLGYSGKAA